MISTIFCLDRLSVFGTTTPFPIVLRRSESVESRVKAVTYVCKPCTKFSPILYSASQVCTVELFLDILWLLYRNSTMRRDKFRSFSC